MMSRFVTSNGFDALITASTMLFVGIFVGVLCFLILTRKSNFTHQKELPFHDEH